MIRFIFEKDHSLCRMGDELQACKTGERKTFKVAVSKMMVKNMLTGQKDVKRIWGCYRTHLDRKGCFHHPVLNSSGAELLAIPQAHSHLHHKPGNYIFQTHPATKFPRL